MIRLRRTCVQSEGDGAFQYCTVYGEVYGQQGYYTTVRTKCNVYDSICEVSMA